MSEWKSWPGFSRYEASHRGFIRNGDRKIMAANPNNNGYLRLNLVGDDGVQRNVLVHRAVLLAHAGPCPPGMVARHWNDDPRDNRWAPGGEEACRAGHGNLLWGTDEENRADRRRNTPAPPQSTPAACIRCGAPVTKGGRRCHECVVWTGMEAARLMRDEGKRLGEANDLLGYGNAEYLHVLAVKYGGWGHCQPCTCSPPATVTLRDRLRRARAAWRDGDGQ
jgi:HNH endonuclease/NUMOD4 motif